MKATWKPIEQYDILKDDFGTTFSLTKFHYTPESHPGRLVNEIELGHRTIWRVAAKTPTHWGTGIVSYDSFAMWVSDDNFEAALFDKKEVKTKDGIFIVSHIPAHSKVLNVKSGTRLISQFLISY